MRVQAGESLERRGIVAGQGGERHAGEKGCCPGLRDSKNGRQEWVNA
jgi:hypothetical protein